MSTQKVPLRVKVDGVKKIIGEAVVDAEDGYFDISATVTDPEWRKKLTQESFFSMHIEANDVKHGEPPGYHIAEVSIKPERPLTYKSRQPIPKDGG